MVQEYIILTLCIVFWGMMMVAFFVEDSRQRKRDIEDEQMLNQTGKMDRQLDHLFSQLADLKNADQSLQSRVSAHEAALNEYRKAPPIAAALTTPETVIIENPRKASHLDDSGADVDAEPEPESAEESASKEERPNVVPPGAIFAQPEEKIPENNEHFVEDKTRHGYEKLRS